jgi:hypothetical protein
MYAMNMQEGTLLDNVIFNAFFLVSWKAHMLRAKPICVSFLFTALKEKMKDFQHYK